MVVTATEGTAFEREFFGFAAVDKQGEFHIHRVRSLQEGICEVRALQDRLGWNPRKPRTELSRCLFRRIARHLKRGEQELRLFASVGTILDGMGVDGFFEYGNRVATINLKVGKRKRPGLKAKFIITRLDFLENRHYIIGDRIAQDLSETAPAYRRFFAQNDRPLLVDL